MEGVSSDEICNPRCSASISAGTLSVTLDKNVDGLMNKFAYNTNCGRSLKDTAGHRPVRKWVDKCQVQYHRDKCELLRLVRSTLRGEYTTMYSSIYNGWTHRSFAIQRDLGVLVHSSINVTT